ncbi:hypothetical protein EVAR_45406_1 [Eumeta japonica]|uniref:Uncharacterized protein n=1 Tax=Eumeta variegata TaxID=151549 RepID=A0A4C1WRE3_EUMVA|nr:hypothetical protein EVAR_45406_1 [Eumeta japonica]
MSLRTAQNPLNSSPNHATIGATENLRSHNPYCQDLGLFNELHRLQPPAQDVHRSTSGGHNDPLKTTSYIQHPLDGPRGGLTPPTGQRSAGPETSYYFRAQSIKIKEAVNYLAHHAQKIHTPREKERDSEWEGREREWERYIQTHRDTQHVRCLDNYFKTYPKQPEFSKFLSTCKTYVVEVEAQTRPCARRVPPVAVHVHPRSVPIDARISFAARVTGSCVANSIKLRNNSSPIKSRRKQCR